MLAHLQVKQLADSLAQKTAACERLTQTSSRLEVQSEKCQAELEQRDIEFKTLEDEHSVLKLEKAQAETHLQAKKQEFDDLLQRWVKEKQVSTDAPPSRALSRCSHCTHTLTSPDL